MNKATKHLGILQKEVISMSEFMQMQVDFQTHCIIISIVRININNIKNRKPKCCFWTGNIQHILCYSDQETRHIQKNGLISKTIEIRYTTPYMKKILGVAVKKQYLYVICLWSALYNSNYSEMDMRIVNQDTVFPVVTCNLALTFVYITLIHKQCLYFAYICDFLTSYIKIY